MSLIMPSGARTVSYSNNVHLHTQPNPYGYSTQQTAAAQNNAQANAYAAADPRFNAKQYQRAGVSSGKGQQYLGAAKGAQAYAQGMAQAQQIGMQDAYSNAQTQLQDQAMRNQYGMALAGLQEDNAQMNYMNALNQQQQAMGFLGDQFKNFTGMFGGGGGSSNGLANSLLSGLL